MWVTNCGGPLPRRTNLKRVRRVGAVDSAPQSAQCSGTPPTYTLAVRRVMQVTLVRTGSPCQGNVLFQDWGWQVRLKRWPALEPCCYHAAGTSWPAADGLPTPALPLSSPVQCMTCTALQKSGRAIHPVDSPSTLFCSA
jgi:hypothetical protein